MGTDAARCPFREPQRLPISADRESSTRRLRASGFRGRRDRRPGSVHVYTSSRSSLYAIDRATRMEVILHSARRSEVVRGAACLLRSPGHFDSWRERPGRPSGRVFDGSYLPRRDTMSGWTRESAAAPCACRGRGSSVSRRRTLSGTDGPPHGEVPVDEPFDVGEEGRSSKSRTTGRSRRRRPARGPIRGRSFPARSGGRSDHVRQVDDVEPPGGRCPVATSTLVTPRLKLANAFSRAF